MTAGSLTRWFLNAIATEYPAGVTATGDLDDDRSPIRLYNADMSMRQRIDTDTTGYEYDASIYGAGAYSGDTIRVTVDDEQTESVELTEAVAVSVSLNNDGEDRAGLGGQEFSRDPVIGVEVEGGYAGAEFDGWGTEQWGTLESDSAFSEIVRRVKDVAYDAADGCIDNAPYGGYHTLEIQNTAPDLGANTDHYRHSFEVALRGYRQRTR